MLSISHANLFSIIYKLIIKIQLLLKINEEKSHIRFFYCTLWWKIHPTPWSVLHSTNFIHKSHSLKLCQLLKVFLLKTLQELWRRYQLISKENCSQILSFMLNFSFSFIYMFQTKINFITTKKHIYKYYFKTLTNLLTCIIQSIWKRVVTSLTKVEKL